MAISHHFTCKKCGKTKNELGAPQDPPTVCAGCRKVDADTKKRMVLEALKLLPIEERLLRIEEILYDLESTPNSMYAHPPIIGGVSRNKPSR